MNEYRSKRLGSGLYHQIEVYDNPIFYHKLVGCLSELDGVKIHLPIYIVEWAPQIIEIEHGLLKCIKHLIQLWNHEKQKPRVIIRTKRGKIIPFFENTKVVLEEWALKEEKTQRGIKGGRV